MKPCVWNLITSVVSTSLFLSSPNILLGIEISICKIAAGMKVKQRAWMCGGGRMSELQGSFKGRAQTFWKENIKIWCIIQYRNKVRTNWVSHADLRLIDDTKRAACKRNLNVLCTEHVAVSAKAFTWVWKVNVSNPSPFIYYPIWIYFCRWLMSVALSWRIPVQR